MTTTKQNKTQAARFGGFAFQLQPDTDLGLAMLIAEAEDGSQQPIGVTGTISEAVEIAECDLRGRMRRIEQGGDGGFCPSRYILWARGIDGDYRVATEINPFE